MKELKALSQNVNNFLDGVNSSERTLILDTHKTFAHLGRPKNTLLYRDDDPINERTSNLLQFESQTAPNLFAQGKLWRHLYFEDVSNCVLADLKDLDYAAASFKPPADSLKQVVYSKLTR